MLDKTSETKSCEKNEEKNSPSTPQSSASSAELASPGRQSSGEGGLNCHVNQYYFHVQPKTTPAKRVDSPPATPHSPASPQYVLNRSDYVPHQKTDRVVAIKNHHIVSQSAYHNQSFFLAQSNGASSKLVVGGAGNNNNNNSSNNSSSAAAANGQGAGGNAGLSRKQFSQRNQMIEQQNRIKSIESQVKKQQTNGNEITGAPVEPAPAAPTQSAPAANSASASSSSSSSNRQQQTSPASSNQISLNHSLSSENGFFSSSFLFIFLLDILFIFSL